MAEKDARDQLLDLLDRKMFEPVLNASPDDYESDNDKQKLADGDCQLELHDGDGMALRYQ